jgi:hypothetical protein
VASEVDICNLALSHLGDVANIITIDPPDGSAQAEHCARFYPIARNALLEMHDWGFASKRVALAQLDNPTTEWAYCYAQPADLLNTISVLANDATDDTSVAIPSPITWNDMVMPALGSGAYTPQPFVLEVLTDGTDVIFTNQAGAVLRYVAQVTDTTKFSPLFITTLSWSLASMLAGPIIKGQAGAAEGVRCHAMAFGQSGSGGWFGKAANSDAGQKRFTTRDRQQTPWLNGR